MISKTIVFEMPNESLDSKAARTADLEGYNYEPGCEKLPRRRGTAPNLTLRVKSRASEYFQIKRLALALLVIHNSTLIQMLHYSRVVPQGAAQRYFPSTAVLLVEVIKFVVSLTVALYRISETSQSWPVPKLGNHVYSILCSGDSWKLLIPAALWTLQNSIIYIAISNLDAATFQVTYQLKIFTTVLFSVVLLGKRISWRQCFALLLLTVGIAIVQAPEAYVGFSTMLARFQSRLAQAFSRKAGSITYTLLEARHMAPTEAHLQENPSLKRVAMNQSRGLLALIAVSLISGVTGVYFEKVLKDSPASTTLWIRNAQLSFFSIFPALFIGVLWQDGKEIGRNGFFVGYGGLVWAIVLLQASGGIIVAVCIKYADNIEKNFATSISVVLSCLGSAWFFDAPLTISFSLGATVVLLSVYLYHKHDG